MNKNTMIPDMHDGYLDAIIVSNKSLILHCRNIDGNKFKLIFSNLLALRADNFLEGNIIFEINIYIGDECPRSLIKHLKNYQQFSEEAHLDNDMKNILETRSYLIELSCSYGCSLLALGAEYLATGSITVEQKHDPGQHDPGQHDPGQ